MRPTFRLSAAPRIYGFTGSYVGWMRRFPDGTRDTIETWARVFVNPTASRRRALTRSFLMSALKTLLASTR